MHTLNDWKNDFLRKVDIRIENVTVTTHPHLYKFSESTEKENGEVTQ